MGKFSKFLYGLLDPNGNRTKKNVFVSLAMVVVFVTTYMLILPAITESTDTYCGHKEHKHIESCYEGGKTLVCMETEGEGHKHNDSCYSVEKELVCGSRESAGHSHDASCYEVVDVLNCTLETEMVAKEDGEEAVAHVHGPECYVQQKHLICDKEECEGHTHSADCYKEEKTLTCNEEEKEGHHHSDDCYEESEKKMICSEEEHEHTLICYSNPNADLESAKDWDKTMKDVELTTNWMQDVLLIADSQLGYEESTRNYEVVDNKKKGYTRYGAWYGVPYGDWCAMFVSFCIDHAGIPTTEEAAKEIAKEMGNKDVVYVPIECGCQNWIEKLNSKETPYYYAINDKNDYKLINDSKDFVPEAGDIIFFNWDNEKDADHVGFVYEVKFDEKDETKIVNIKTIEGNSSDKVKYNNYQPNDESIMGYARLPKNPNEQVPETEAETTEVQTTKAVETTEVETTKAAETTEVETTKAAETTEVETTKAAETTEVETAKAPETTQAAETTEVETTKAPETTQSGTTQAAETTEVEITAEESSSDLESEYSENETSEREITEGETLASETEETSEGMTTDESEEESSIEETETGSEANPEMQEMCFEKSFEGEDYTVTVSYSMEAELPLDVRLIAEEIAKDSDTFKECLAEAAKALGADASMDTSTEEIAEESEAEAADLSGQFTFARFFDISFVSDGQEFEPKAPVNVTISYKETVDLNNAQTAVVHFAETGVEVLEVETSLGAADAVDTDNEKKEDSAENSNIVDTFTYTQDSFSITGTVVTANQLEYGNHILYVEYNGKYYALSRTGGAVEVTVSNGIVTCADNDRQDIIWNYESWSNNQMYISNTNDTNKVYIRPANSGVVSETKTGLNYTTFTNGTAKLYRPTNTANTYRYLQYNGGSSFVSTTTAANGSVIHFATNITTTTEGDYYKLVTSIDPNKEYLIVQKSGNYALTVNGTSGVKSTQLTLQPTLESDTYQISGVTNDMKWTFPDYNGTNSKALSVGNSRRLVIGYNSSDSISLDDGGSSGNGTVLPTYVSTENAWRLQRYNRTNYLGMNGTSFVTVGNPSGTNLTNSYMYILEKVDPPSGGDDPGTGGGGGGNNPTLPKPDYPGYKETSDAIKEDTSISGVKGTAYSDAATSMLEAQFSGKPSDDGKVLTDKSVIYKKDDYDAFNTYADNTFGVTLSALAQQYEQGENYQVTAPMDVLFILDVSGSMDNTTSTGETRRAALVNAVNSSMKQIFDQNPENRAGVVLYSSGSWDLLDLGHYTTGSDGKYLVTENSNQTIRTSTNLKNSSGQSVARKEDACNANNQRHGTYTQSGIARGAAMLGRVEQEDTVYEATLDPGTDHEKKVTVTRQPVIILLSDGDPTFCTNNYTNVLSGPHYGNGVYTQANNNRGVMGYYTILSANYYKKQVGDHYGTAAKFFTVGMGINQTGYADLSEQSATGDHYKRAVLDPTAANIQALTNTSAKNYSTTSHQMRDLLASNYNGTTVSVQSTSSYSQLGTTQTSVPVIKNPYSNYSYADKSYFGNITQSELTNIFKDIIADSLMVKKYGFILAKRTAVELEDTIGAGMELKSDPVLRYGGNNYYADPKLTHTEGAVTTYVYDAEYSAQDGSGYKADLKQITVTVTTDPETGTQVVRMKVPDSAIPVYAPCEIVGNDWYYEALPVRLIYQVGLTDASVQEIEKMPAGQTKTYYTNQYNPENLAEGANSIHRPQNDNPYYKGTGGYKDSSTAKNENVTDTVQNSSQSVQGTGTYEGENVKVIDCYLGNNGKLEFTGNKINKIDIIIKKTDLQDNNKLLDGAEFRLYTDEALQNEWGNGPYTTANGVVTINDLDVDKTYYLVETKAPDGYNPVSTKSFIIEGNVTPTISGTEDSEIKIDRDQFILTISDPPIEYYELPHTGGAGTGIFRWAGMMLILAAGMLLLKQSNTKGRLR